MNSKTLVSILVVLALVASVIAGCKSYSGQELPEGLTSPVNAPVTTLAQASAGSSTTLAVQKSTTTTIAQPASPAKKLPVIFVKEGDRVSFPSLLKVDQDSDVITYTFTSPLDKNGEWLTKIGDEGNYTVTITASDGKSTTMQDVIISVEALNLPPTIVGPDTINVKETDVIDLKSLFTIADPNKDPVTVKYSGWMTKSAYTTTYDDSGTHYVTISATDGKKETTRTVKIIVANLDRAPVLQPISNVNVIEGQLVTVAPSASDADSGDVLTYTYGAPLDRNGAWQTKIGDAGTYDSRVTVSDGQLSATKDVAITVAKYNHPPVFSVLNRNMLVTVYPNSTATVRIEPVVTDADNDPVTITYSGWMISNQRTVTYNDGGVHTVTLTASDGKDTTTAIVTVTINRAPMIII